jgi:Tol biopolymer transport system component
MGKFCPLGVGRTAIALSPDGSLLVYAGEQNGKSHLFARPLDSFEARPIPGTEGAYAPFFSPDGRSIAFFAANTLLRVSLEGGQPVTLCWVDCSGATSPIAAPARAYQNFSLSPDGQRVALEISEATHDVYLYEFARGGLIRFTNDGDN